MLNPLSPYVALSKPGRLEGRRVLIVKAGRHDTLRDGARAEAAMGLLFAREGARIVIADFDKSVATEAADRIRSQGGEAYAIRTDLALEADVVWMMHEACKSLGGNLDGLVLNAASSGNAEHRHPDAQEWARIFDLSVRGTMLCCREALSRFRDGGSVVFMASMNALGAGRERTVYDTAGAAIAGLMRNVAEDVGPRAIRANLVDCHPQRGPCFGLHADNLLFPDGQARGRRSAEAAIANSVLFFLSDESAGVTAQTLTVLQGRNPPGFEG